MNFNSLISNINWIQVIILTFLSFLIGFAWHQPFLFGKIWKKENFQNGMPEIKPALIFGGTALMHFLAISSLSAVISGHGGLNGIITGFLISILWILPAMTGTYLFANRSIKLLAVDSGMYIVLFSLSGFVLGIWG